MSAALVLRDAKRRLASQDEKFLVKPFLALTRRSVAKPSVSKGEIRASPQYSAGFGAFVTLTAAFFSKERTPASATNVAA